MRYIDWRGWLGVVTRLWRTSLQLRTVAITVALSSLTVFVIGAYMSISVGNNLYEARLEQAREASARATIAAQDRFDAGEEAEAVDLDATMQRALEAAAQASSTQDGATRIAILRTPGQSGLGAPVDRSTGALDTDLISDDLRESVAASPERRTFSQSIALPATDGSTVPGLAEQGARDGAASVEAGEPEDQQAEDDERRDDDEHDEEAEGGRPFRVADLEAVHPLGQRPEELVEPGRPRLLVLALGELLGEEVAGALGVGIEGDLERAQAHGDPVGGAGAVVRGS